MSKNLFIVEIPNGGEAYWLADWSGDPGRTVLRENAKLFPSLAAAARRLAAEQKSCGYYRKSLFEAQIIKVSPPSSAPMKCPNKKAGLPETAPFPHEYALDAEYLLKMMEYNMRVYMLAMIEATARVDREFIVTPRQALACAMQVECERVAKEVGSHLVQDIELVTLLRKLNIHTT